MSETRQHETVIELPASPERVWEAITTAGGMQTWFAPEARSDAREGGEYFVSWGEGMDGGGTIEVFTPGQHLRLASARGPAIDIYLTPEASGTTLRLVHSGFLSSSDWDSEFNGTKHGWPIMLRILQFSLAKYPDLPGKQGWFYAKVAPAAVQALLAGRPVVYSDPPGELAVEWSDMGPGLIYADISKSAVSCNVVLYGDAIARLDEAVAYWKAALSAA
jgi:uncharacterized protein YndB with AHSA1/START domain